MWFIGRIRLKKKTWLEITFSAKCVFLRCEFICFRAVRRSGLSEYVGSSVWMSGSSDSQLERTPLCLWFTPLRVWRLWHHEALWPKFTSSAAQGGERSFSVSVVVGWRQIVPLCPCGCQSSSAESDVTGPNGFGVASSKWALSWWEN